MALTNAERQARYRAEQREQQTMIGHTQRAIIALNAAYDAGYISSDDWHDARNALETVLTVAARASRAEARETLARLATPAKG